MPEATTAAPAVITTAPVVTTTPAVTTTTAAPAVTTTAPVVTTTAPASGVEWLPGADADTVGLVGLKGWKSAADAVQAYKHAQSFVGADPNTIVRLPGANADQATKDAFYTKLGRPVDAKGYDIAVPTGADAKYADWARGTFLELGLTAEQGKALAAKNNEFIAVAGKAAQDARTVEWTAQNAALAKEWGSAHAQNVALVDKATHALGLDQATLEAVRDAMGPLKAMKFFHGLASKIGEDSFVTPEHRDTGFSHVLAPAEAQARIKELRNDKEWAKAYLNKDAAKMAEMRQLQAWAFPDAQAA